MAKVGTAAERRKKGWSIYKAAPVRVEEEFRVVGSKIRVPYEAVTNRKRPRISGQYGHLIPKLGGMC